MYVGSCAECCESKESFECLGNKKEIKNLTYPFIRPYASMCAMLTIDEEESQIFIRDLQTYCSVSIKKNTQRTNSHSVTVHNGHIVHLYKEKLLKTEGKNTQPGLSNLVTKFFSFLDRTTKIMDESYDLECSHFSLEFDLEQNNTILNYDSVSSLVKYY